MSTGWSYPWPWIVTTQTPVIPGTRWDAGITWLSRRVTAPTELPVSVAYIRDGLLRVTNGSVEDEFILRAIKAAVDVCEDETQTALMPQTWELVLSAFPASQRIELPRPPFLSLTSVEYYDGDGAYQTLAAASPSDVRVSPSGRYAPAFLTPMTDTSFPATQVRGDAVTITYQAGHATADDVPERIISGIGLMVGELYKQRSLSQVGTSIVSAPLDTRRFWKRQW